LNNTAEQIASERIRDFMTKNQPTTLTLIAPTTYKTPTRLFHPNTPIPHDDTTNELTFPTLNEGYIDPNLTGQPPISPGGPPQYVQAVLEACPTKKVAEPSVFNGTPSKFSTWLHQIRIYLAVNTANYTTGWMKTFFVLSYMKEGAANAWAKEYQVSRDYSTTDYTTANFDKHPANAPARHRPTFMEYLKLQFVDPLKRQEAQQKLPLLKMTDKTGQMFIAKLNTLFQQAGIINDRNKVIFFMRLIKDEIRAQILQITGLTTESTYAQWTTQFLLINQGCRMAEGWKKGTQLSFAPTTTTTKGTDPDTMEINAINTNIKQCTFCNLLRHKAKTCWKRVRQPQTQGNRAGALSNTSSTGPRRDQECFCCGRKGHFAKECFSKKHQNGGPLKERPSGQARLQPDNYQNCQVDQEVEDAMPTLPQSMRTITEDNWKCLQGFNEWSQRVSQQQYGVQQQIMGPPSNNVFHPSLTPTQSPYPHATYMQQTPQQPPFQ
jgi:hypothetical protein